MTSPWTAQPALVVHGLDLSYFTGKLEAYLRAKGIPYELREMTTRSFRDCGRATGFLQMPQVECPDGTWLTDTTLVMRHIERLHPDPPLSPSDPLVKFISVLLEDFGDEALWRPALYYRWAFADDARLMSGRLARGMLRDVNLPFFLRRQFILRRQQNVYLKRDGVTSSNRHAIEALYRNTLAATEAALEHTPFVLGMRPTEADFGLFGSMFRHFFCDPTPARIMRDSAPRTLSWVARLWGIGPAAFSGQPLPVEVPGACAPLLRLVASSHLPVLDANARAFAEGRPTVRFTDHGGAFEVPVSPYRVWCLASLQAAFAALDDVGQGRALALLGGVDTARILAGKADTNGIAIPELPIRPAAAATARPRDRNWR